jgi:hypothetical protein
VCQPNSFEKLRRFVPYCQEFTILPLRDKFAWAGPAGQAGFSSLVVPIPPGMTGSYRAEDDKVIERLCDALLAGLSC